MCRKNKIKTPKTIQRCVVTSHSLCKNGTLRHHSLTDLLTDLPVLKKGKKNKQFVVIFVQAGLNIFGLS